LRRDHIGFVFQSYHLFPTLNALDNVRLALDVRGEHSSRAVKRSEDALARVGLAHKVDAYPRELSGGAAVGSSARIASGSPIRARDALLFAPPSWRFSPRSPRIRHMAYW